MDRVDRILKQWSQERPDLDVAAMGTIGRLKRLNQHLGRTMAETWSGHDLTPAGFDVLATLRRAGPPYSLSPGDLMTSTMVTSGTITHRIDLLARAGLVERKRNPEDGRGFLVALTDQGYRVIDAAVTDHVATQNELVAALSAEQRTHLDTLLKALLNDFEPD